MKSLIKISIILLVVAAALTVQVLAGAALADGSYTIAVTLSGGSGRAQVESPAEITVQNGVITAVIVWSSPNYDYMLIDGTYYSPVNTEGNSTFEVKVPSLDTVIALSAETVAMSEPHVIDYTLYFDSSSLVSLDENNGAPLSLSEMIMIAAAAVVVVVLVSSGCGALRRRAKQNETAETGEKR